MKKAFACVVLVAIMSQITPFAQAYTWDEISGYYNDDNQIQGLTTTYDHVASDTGLYGDMQISGDNMWFFPTAFQAQVGDGATQLLDETLQFELTSKPGGGAGADRFIDSIQFIEYGDYGLIDNIGGAGTDATNASVTCGLTVQILERNRSSVFEFPIQAYLTFTPSEGDYFLDADGATAQTLWQGSLNLDLPYDDITKIQVSIDNTLNVASETGTIARIEKKGLGEAPAVVISPVIPEPATLVLLGLGGLMLRRKK